MNEYIFVIMVEQHSKENLPENEFLNEDITDDRDEDELDFDSPTLNTESGRPRRSKR